MDGYKTNNSIIRKLRNKVGIATMLGGAALYGAGCGGDGGGTTNPPPPPPPPTVVLQSVSCNIDAITDYNYEEQFPNISPSGDNSYGNLSDGNKIALDSIVLKTNGVRNDKIAGVNGSWTGLIIDHDDLKEGSNTESATCYASKDGTSKTKTDTESFTLTKTQDPLPTIGTLPSIELKEDGSVGASTAGLVSDGDLTNVTSTSGNVTVQYKSDKDSVYVTPAADWNGQYTLQFKAENATGPVTKDGTYTVTALPDLLAGQLQDNETDSGKAGQLELLIDGAQIGTIDTDGNGNWNKQNLPEGSELTIKAELDQGSYIRTVRANIANGQDVNFDLIRAVPYTGLSANGISPELYKDFVKDFFKLPVNEGKLQKFEIENFNGVQIIQDSPETDLGGNQGTFSQNEVDLIEKENLDPTDIAKWFEGQIPYVVIDNSPIHYSLSPIGTVIPEEGWIIFVPDKYMNAGASASSRDTDNNGIYDAGIIRIKPSLTQQTLERAISHEYEHALWFGDHTTTLPATKTITRIPVEIEKPAFADEKLAKLAHEATFEDGEDLDDILGQ